MFGIGFEEFFVIAVILVIVVGPDKMPVFFKTIGRGLRTFRKTTRELKSSIGLDELLEDEDLRDLRRPLHQQRRPKKYRFTQEDVDREYPLIGADLDDATHRELEDEYDPDAEAADGEAVTTEAQPVPTAKPTRVEVPADEDRAASETVSASLDANGVEPEHEEEEEAEAVEMSSLVKPREPEPVEGR